MGVTVNNFVLSQDPATKYIAFPAAGSQLLFNRKYLYSDSSNKNNKRDVFGQTQCIAKLLLKTGG